MNHMQAFVRTGSLTLPRGYTLSSRPNAIIFISDSFCWNVFKDEKILTLTKRQKMHRLLNVSRDIKVQKHFLCFRKFVELMTSSYCTERVSFG